MRKDKPLIHIIDKKWYFYEIIKVSILLGFICVYWFGAGWGIVPGILYAGYVVRKDRETYYSKKLAKVRTEFKDFLVLLSGNLSAGYALENAFLRTASDMKKQYGDSYAIRFGVERCVRGIHVNQSIDALFMKFADSVGIEEIADCAKLLSLAKKYGGNMISMLKRVADNISKFLTAEQEIETSEAQKRLEGKIMLVAPFAVVIYMRVTNPNHMTILYETMFGHILMIVALGVISLVGIWMDYIMKI